jgi:recombinational DNA repair protein (RecF pathway)
MREYVTLAVVLDKEPVGEKDSRVQVFTERYGKLIGRATSARKITSKLAAHLEPGTITKLRLVEQKGLRITDSLMIRRSAALAPDLHLLSKMLPEGEPEPELWELFLNDSFTWRSALRVLGWDPLGSACAVCGSKTEAFSSRFHEFFCGEHALKLSAHEVVYI